MEEKRKRPIASSRNSVLAVVLLVLLVLVLLLYLFVSGLGGAPGEREVNGSSRAAAP